MNGRNSFGILSFTLLLALCATEAASADCRPPLVDREFEIVDINIDWAAPASCLAVPVDPDLKAMWFDCEGGDYRVGMRILADLRFYWVNDQRGRPECNYTYLVPKRKI